MAVSAAVAVIGVSYGASAHAIGFPVWAIALVAASVLSATAELLFVSLLAAGAAPLVAAASGILAGLRNGVYGISVASVMGSRRERIIGAHLVNDETAAFAAVQPDPRSRRRGFWIMGAGVLIGWVGGALVGQLLGQHVVAPDVIGLDAAFPALLLAILLNLAREMPTRAAALAGALIAAVSAPRVAPGLGPVLALTALVIPWAMRIRARRRSAA